MSIVLALLTPTALALTPADTFDGVDPQRVRWQNPDEQGRLLAGAGWQDWLATDGAGWQARFDEATGTPRYLWGRGIPMPADRDGLVVALIGLLDRHAALLGYEPGTLALRSANYSPEVNTWYVELDPLRAGLPTYRGGISARIKAGNLVFLQVGTAPNADVSGTLRIPADDAVRLAIAQGPEPEADHRDPVATPMLLERKSLDDFALRATWMVRTTTADPPGRWVSFVDGETGEFLSVFNEVRYTGTVSGKHHERTLDGSPLVVDPMPYIQVKSDGNTTDADETGYYTVGGNGPYTSVLNGSYVNVKNDGGSAGALSDSDPDLVWTSSDANQAEIDTYVFVTQVRAWGLVFGPGVSWVTKPITAHVNENQTCNAYWDGELNFFKSGGGCNNTGEIADVVYHEWGHGFHYYSLQGGVFDGSLSEGAADTVSMLQTLDSNIGPYFFTDGGPVRNVGPDKKYPQDYVNNDQYVHENGEIFGGAMWDLLNLLMDEYGTVPGDAATSVIHAGLLKGGPDVPGSFYEALVADDDDGDLANGTPHVCEIFDAFGRHGLGTNTSVDAVLVSHDPISGAEADKAVPVSVDLVSVAAGCKAVGADDAHLHYRVDGGSWKSVSMSTGGTNVDGDVPAQPDGSFVEYYVTGDSDDGTAFSSPEVGEAAPYSFYVGDSLEVRCDLFDSDDGGYTVTDGNDWEHGDPAGLYGDPSSAFSGKKVWGTDLDHDGEYTNDDFNAIASPSIDTGWFTGVFLQYRRWLRVEDSTYDHATISVDGQDVWTNFLGDGHQAHLDSTWVNHAVDLQGLADQHKVQLGFSLLSDHALQFGGWNVDDVCLRAPATPDNRLGIGDLTVTATGDTTAHLTWTNPKYAPLQTVRVVRRVDRYPTSVDDGDVAEEITDPVVGEKVDVDDVNGHRGATYYAVYGFDGADWLGWTVEGWNAATVQLAGGDVPLEDQFDTGVAYRPLNGCSCDQRSGPSAPLLAAGLLTLLVRRRSSARQ